MPKGKKPICLGCKKKRAAWPKKQPTFCTQKCAAWYGFTSADNMSYCPKHEKWWDYYSYNDCPDCAEDMIECSSCGLLYDYDEDKPGCPHCT